LPYPIISIANWNKKCHRVSECSITRKYFYPLNFQYLRIMNNIKFFFWIN
jgi:hypothetical protein